MISYESLWVLESWTTFEQSFCKNRSSPIFAHFIKAEKYFIYDIFISFIHFTIDHKMWLFFWKRKYYLTSTMINDESKRTIFFLFYSHSFIFWYKKRTRRERIVQGWTIKLFSFVIFVLHKLCKSCIYYLPTFHGFKIFE